MKDDAIFWCYGDIHEHVEAAQSFLDRVKPKRVIWLGDFLDTHGRNAGDFSLEQAARFMEQTVLNRPQDTFILGNHEMPYLFRYEGYMGYGCSPRRLALFEKIWEKTLWNKFKVFHFETLPNGKPLLLSHAGFEPSFIKAVIGECEWKPQSFQLYVDVETHQAFKQPKDPNALFESRNGPLWIRWQYLHVGPVNQIVGHTIQQEPQIKYSGDRRNWNINIDCARRFCVKVTRKGVFRVNVKTLDESLLVGF